jgi:cytosine/adenosine deaminase-related metal-dependent hydrolase
VSSRTLIRGGTVLTLGARTPNFDSADVLIEGGRVAEIGPGLRARDAEVVDATNTIVMPGFVDVHRHTWQSLFRNLDGTATGDTLTPADRLGPHYRAEDAYAGTLIGLLGSIEAGITTVVDLSDIQMGADFAEAVLQAHSDAGVRTVFVPASPPWGSQTEDSSLLAEAVSLASSRGVAAAVGASSPAGVESAEREWQLARERGWRIHVHAGARPREAGQVLRPAQLGRLGPDVTLVHCSYLEESDLDAIASARAEVCLTPATEMTGGATPPVQALLDRGIRPGLGTDRHGMSPGDMFAQMRSVISLQHARMFDLKLAGKASLPQLMNTRDVIRFATIDGARAAGLADTSGSIEPGKAADLILLRTDRPNIHPVNDPIGAVVWGMDTSNIHWVFVGGKPVLREGALQIDVGRAVRLANAARDRILEQSGLRSGVGGAA